MARWHGVALLAAVALFSPFVSGEISFVDPNSQSDIIPHATTTGTKHPRVRKHLHPSSIFSL